MYAGDGTLISSTLEAKSNSKNRNQIIEVGIAGRPAGTDTPDSGGTGGTTPPDSGSTGGDTPVQPPEDTPPAEEENNEIPAWLLPQ